MACAAIVLLAGALLAGAQATTASKPAVAPRLSVPVPPAVVVSDGLHRLLYELHVENRGDAAVTLSRVDIYAETSSVLPKGKAANGNAATTNAATANAEGTLVLRLEGDRLVRALDVPADRQAPLAVAAGGRRVVYVDLGEKAPPRVLRHELHVDEQAPSAARDIAAEAALDVIVDPAPPAVLGAPLAGGPWAAVYHSDWERGHRRVFYTVDGVTRLPGRYTIDFVRLDDAGRTTRGDSGDSGESDVVAKSLGYGVDVLAVSDAIVAAVRDDMSEVARVSARVKNKQEDAAGNYVSLDLGNGRFAVYEHLKPRSIRVRPGQRVRRGDTIAQLGFTGDSTGPHLHLHVGDAASPLGAEGRAFVFDRFEVLGRYADIGAMGKTRWQADGAGRRRNERPGPNTVIDFASPR
jgi:murein DD-endopeptidase MepM/ murein hydrolase activator NlpD